MMGFESALRKKENTKISTYLETVDNLSKNDTKIITFSISDSVVVLKKMENNMKETLKNLIKIIASFQIECAIKGIWTRGALTLGNVTYDETKNRVYGIPLAEAYHIEKTYAIYPRVIVDPKVLRNISIKSTEYSTLNLYDHQNNGIITNSVNLSIQDDYPFINFFGFSVNQVREDYDLTEATKIFNSLKYVYNSDIQFHSKFCWLRKYFIHSLDRCASQKAYLIEKIRKLQNEVEAL